MNAYIRFRCFWSQKAIQTVLKYPRFWGAFVRSPLAPSTGMRWREAFLMYGLFLGFIYWLQGDLTQNEALFTPMAVLLSTSILLGAMVVQWRRAGRKAHHVTVDSEDLLALLQCHRPGWTLAHQQAFRYTSAERRYTKMLRLQLQERQFQKWGQKVLNLSLKQDLDFSNEEIPYSPYPVKSKPHSH